MNLRVVAQTTLLLSIVGFTYGDDRGSLVGTWESQSGGDTGGRATWVLEEKGEIWHIAYSEGNQKPAEFDCAADGRECTVKESGHAAKISLWFSGPMLVELETKGSEVIKRRFAIAERGDEMNVEVIPVVSKVKPATLHFKRTNLTASK